MKVKKKYEDKYCKKQIIELDDGYIIENSYCYPYWICLTTQVGCPIGCKFCKSGSLGFKRNLTSDEILMQIVFAMQESIGELDYSLMFMVVSFSGMGEPLLNIESVIDIINLLQNKSIVQINISTSGIVENLKFLFELKEPINLDISMHASNSEKRFKLIPSERKYPIQKTLKYLIHNKDKFKTITFDYLLLENINCDKDDIDNLVKEFQELSFGIEIKRYNSICHDEFCAPSQEVFRQFEQELIKHKINVIIEESLGTDINAGCGQLVWDNLYKEDNFNENGNYICKNRRTLC